jgi:ubiquinone/menaquinone biosynthesis C-methylase UbiE
MQKSLYQDKTFATYWNERAGDEGEVYKRYVLDPLMFKAVGSFKDKVVMDLGCGNGYLAPKLLKESPKQIIMADISEHNLRHAAQKCDDPRVSFLQQDATEPWDVKSDSVDIIYSNMMLNEMDNIKAPSQEAFRVLKESGIFIFSVTHPAWDLYIYAQAQLGVSSKKIKALGGYFRRGHAKFLMSGETKSNLKLKEKYKQTFEVEHYQRPLSDYFDSVADAGFTVKRIFEPAPTKELLENSPRFAEYKDNPVGLVFYCVKP